MKNASMQVFSGLRVKKVNKKVKLFTKRGVLTLLNRLFQQDFGTIQAINVV